MYAVCVKLAQCEEQVKALCQFSKGSCQKKKKNLNPSELNLSVKHDLWI